MYTSIEIWSVQFNIITHSKYHAVSISKGNVRKQLITLQSPPEQMLELVATSPAQMDQKEVAVHLD